jgi:hypothetical protein
MALGLLPIILGGVGAWILGALWYSPLLFSKAWQEGHGLTAEKLKTINPAIAYGLSLVCMIGMSFGLSFIIGAHSDAERTLTHGFFHGCMAGIWFAAMSVGINYLYQGKSLKVYLIDAVYQVLLLGVSGAIMAFMS